MDKELIDGVDVTVASPEQLQTYVTAQQQVENFQAPELYQSSNPNARVFFALFDGTGNDAIKDPKHMTNVGLLNMQVEKLAEKDPNIGRFYKEGPGTQDGLRGIIDGATGGTYQERVEAMYEQFSRQSAQWLKENPNAEISVVSVGFSRGAEQAAGFSRLVEERGIQNPEGRQSERNILGKEDVQTISYVTPPLREGGTVPQALALYDPVGTGAPEKFDRRPPPSVVSGLQINAGNEYRTSFPSTNILPQGLSEDGRFLGVTTAGAHSNIGGSYLLNGLSNRNFNLMADYLNKTLGQPMIKPLEVPREPEKNVIHDSTQHLYGLYRRTEERENIRHPEPTGTKAIEPVNPQFAQRYLAQQSSLGQTSSPTLSNVQTAELTNKLSTVSERTPVGSPMSTKDIENLQRTLGENAHRMIQPQSRGNYDGKVVYMTDTHLVQQINKSSLVLHDLSKLENGEKLGNLFDQGRLTNQVLTIKYGEEKGSAGILPRNGQHTEEAKKQAGVWAEKNLSNDKSRQLFMAHVENLAKDVNHYQAAKIPDAPAVQKTASVLEKNR